MKPTKDRLLVRVEEKKPVKGKELEAATSIMTAEVVAVGPKVEVVKVKDKVVFAPYGIDEVLVDGKKLLIVAEDSILAIHGKK